MVKNRYLKPALVGLLVLVALYVWFAPGSGSPAQRVATGQPATARREAAGPRADAVPAIDLARATAPREPSGAGKRNVFEYYAPPPPPVALPQPVVDLVPSEPTPTPIPPLNLKYVGSAERSGVRKAIFMTDHNEVLTGSVGETVGNRVKVVRINLESIDVQDLWSGQPRRIPLKGN